MSEALTGFMIGLPIGVMIGASIVYLLTVDAPQRRIERDRDTRAVLRSASRPSWSVRTKERGR